MSDCEIAQYVVTKEHVARVQHTCIECHSPIFPGEKYLQINACWEGRPDTYRQHILCENACEFVRNKGLNDDECLYFGELLEWWPEWVKGGYCHDAELSDRAALWRMMLGIYRRQKRYRQAKERLSA